MITKYLCYTTQYKPQQNQIYKCQLHQKHPKSTDCYCDYQKIILDIFKITFFRMIINKQKQTNNNGASKNVCENLICSSKNQLNLSLANIYLFKFVSKIN